MMKDRYTSTATEALIAGMESLGEAEETQVLVLMRNSEGVCGTVSNLNYYTDRIGLLQAQLMWEQAGMVKTESGQ
jgi:hypothetical protein